MGCLYAPRKLRLIKTCSLISNSFFTALNFWHFRRMSTLTVSQTWLQTSKYCTYVREKIKYMQTEMGDLHVKKYILLD